MKLSLIGRHFAIRLFAWRWSKPVARTLLVAGGLVLLALLGRSTLAGATAPTAAASVDIMGAAAAPSSATQVAADAASPPPVGPPSLPAGEAAPAALRVQGPATPEDPVFLNQANAEDLRRLPGIGQKRALAILTLRAKVGRFRQIEDLMRVKGIGRATLKKLRPLVKLDLPAPPPSAADGGAT